MYVSIKYIVFFSPRFILFAFVFFYVLILDFEMYIIRIRLQILKICTVLGQFYDHPQQLP